MARMPISRTVKLLVPIVIAFFSLPAFSLQEGYASWYGGKFNGRLTSNGEVFDTNVKTAAHKTLPFGSIVKVVNLENGKSTVVRINDRGPFVEGRIIDLSRAAAEELGMVSQGIAKVSVQVVDFMRGLDLYAIQIGSYSQERNAEAARRVLEEAGFIVFLEKNPIGNIRVQVKGIKEKDIAAARSRLEELGFRNPLVKKDPDGDTAP
jgi:rare lipoprotein A